MFFLFPMFLHFRNRRIELCEFIVQHIESLDRGLVAFFFECDLFDLELENPSLGDINLSWERVNLYAQL